MRLVEQLEAEERCDLRDDLRDERVWRSKLRECGDVLRLVAEELAKRREPQALEVRFGSPLTSA